MRSSVLPVTVLPCLSSRSQRCSRSLSSFSSLGEAWPPLSHIDFPLIVVVYVALQRDAWTALIVGTIAGLAIDIPSGGLIGAGGFSKTLTAYLVYLGATRVNLEMH